MATRSFEETGRIRVVDGAGREHVVVVITEFHELRTQSGAIPRQPVMHELRLSTGEPVNRSAAGDLTLAATGARLRVV